MCASIVDFMNICLPDYGVICVINHTIAGLRTKNHMSANVLRAHTMGGCSPEGSGVKLLTWSLIVFISPAYAQAADSAATPASSLMSMLPMVLMFVVLYFVMIRPQMKRQKEHKAMIDAVAKGDEVVVAGGLLGKVTNVTDQVLKVEVANGVQVQVQRQAVVQVLPKGSIV
jgi:preprotein translocase subunit YajC